MLVDQNVKIRWNSYSKSYYENRGYIYTKMHDEFEVDVRDLIPNSTYDVTVMCDYCGKLYTVKLNNRSTNMNRSPIKKDCCLSCVSNKIKETNLLKYGCENVMHNSGFKAKQQDTVLRRYGVSNVMLDPDIMDKFHKSMLSNNATPTSSQQYELYNILHSNGFDVYLNYPCGKYTLDIALFIGDIMLDIEYDGWYWHKDKKQYDTIRDNHMRDHGWKIIRVRGTTRLPNYNELMDRIRVLVNTNFDYSAIVMDDWIYKECSNNNN